MDSSSNRRLTPGQRRGRSRQTAWLWVIIGICIVVLAWVLLRPSTTQAPVTLFEMSNQSAALHYQNNEFAAGDWIRIDYSVSSCTHDVAAGWDVWFNLEHVQTVQGMDATGPVWVHRASCGDSGTTTLHVEDGTYAPTASPGSGARWSLKITQL